MGEAPGKDRKRIWYGLLSAALAAVLLYYSLRGVEWARVWTTIIHARGQFLAVAGLTLCCSFFLRSYRWRKEQHKVRLFFFPALVSLAHPAQHGRRLRRD